MKTNITLKIDKDLLRKIRIVAAENDTSVSALLSQHLENIVRDREGYEAAKKRALANLRRGFNLGYVPAKSRDELHER